MTLQRKNEGFTIVELLIVIVVIGILAALVVTTFTGIQQRARNTERETDIKAIHSQLEAYYAQNGSYPALSDVNDATWRGTNMKGLDSEALKDPKGTAQTLTATVGTNPPSYRYDPTQTDNSACTTAAGNCAKYTLEADLEGSAPNFSKTSLN